MGGPAGIAILALLVIVAGIRAAVALHHNYIRPRCREGEKDADLIASELELQLQSELEDAINSSTPFLSSATESSSEKSSTYSQSDSAPRVRFSDDESDSISWSAFKLEGRAKLREFAKSVIPNLKTNFSSDRSISHTGAAETKNHAKDAPSSYQTSPGSMQLPLPVSIGLLGEEAAVLVNAKQYDRILKRRMARQLIESFFLSRLQGKSLKLRGDSGISNMRRPRKAGGRFLTREELRQMESGLQIDGESMTMVSAS